MRRSPCITKDGVTVAEDIELSDPYENLGAQLVKEAKAFHNNVEAAQDMRFVEIPYPDV